LTPSAIIDLNCAGKSAKGTKAKNPGRPSKKQAEDPTTPVAGSSKEPPAKKRKDEDTQGLSNSTSTVVGPVSTTSLASFKIPRVEHPAAQQQHTDALGQSMRNLNPFSKYHNPSTFSCPIESRALLPSNCLDLATLEANMRKLVINSNSKSTWNKHHSAWRNYENFCVSQKIRAWPASVTNVRAYVTSELSIRKLQSDTVKSYVSSLDRFHELKNWDRTDALKDPIVKLMLKGAQNIEPPIAKKQKIAMSPPLLALLGHELHKSNLDDYTKQLVWTASLCCFFTSCRMGELLPSAAHESNCKFALRWKNLTEVGDGGFVIFLPYTKTKGAAGEYTDVFKMNCSYCPVSAILRLKEMQLSRKMYHSDNMVFMFPDKKALSKMYMNRMLDHFLSKYCSEKNQLVTCKSFRSAMPSLLEINLANDAQIKLWGRWSSDSFNRYTKFTREKKKLIFAKLCSDSAMKPLFNK